MHKIYRLALLLLAVIGGAYALASPRIAWAADIAFDISTLRDSSRSLGLQQILELHPSRFKPASRNDINFGYTTDAIWLRIAVTCKNDTNAILSLTPNFVDFIDIHVASKAGASAATDYALHLTGDHRPVPSDGMTGLHDAVNLELRKGETALVYVRLANVSSALTTEINIYPRQEQPHRQILSILTAGVWFGSMGILGIVQLVFFYFDRKPYNLLLAIATFMVIAVYVGSLGVSRVFLFSAGGNGNDVFVAVSIWTSMICSTFSCIFILNIRRKTWLLKIFILSALVGVIGVICGILGLQLYFAPFGNNAVIVIATVAALYSLYTVNTGGAATQLRATAYVLLWVGVVSIMVQRTAWINLPVWIVHAYASACLLQTILLTASVGVRLRAAENLNLAMQKQALASAKNAEIQAKILVEERTRELVATQRMAEDALQAELASQRLQVRFMEVISHQYRTPLAAIRTHIDNIGVSLPSADTANQTRLERVRKGILRLVEVLEINLSRAKLQGPSFQPSLARASITDIAEAAAARARDLLQSAILTEIPGDTHINVKADAEMLTLAIVNLLENAVKYSRPKTREPIVLSCQTKGGDVFISVIDKGIGIPAEEIGRVTEAGWRGSNARELEGTGMGLSLVTRIISVHDGAVSIESIENQGTTVTISLPLLPC